MRHIIVRRSAGLLGVLLFAAAALFAVVVGRPPATQPPTPESQAPVATEVDLFNRRCGSCHAIDDLRPPLIAGGEPARRRLEIFLEQHGDATVQENLRIIDYLARDGQ